MGRTTPSPTQPNLECHTSSTRLALRVEEAAAALGISDESFARYVKDQVRVVRLGSLRLYPVPELERFLAERAELVLGYGDGKPVAPRKAAPQAVSRSPVEGRWK